MSSRTVCTSFITHRGLSYNRRTWGSADGGRRVLLIHGLGSNACVWDLVAPALVEAGLQPTAFDMRGHGLSAKPNDGYDFNTLCEDLHGLVESCRLADPILVGHSFGAMLALDYAARYRRGRWSAAGLVLIDGGMSQLDSYPGATLDGVVEVLAPPKFESTTLAEFLAHFKDADRKWNPDERALELILTNFEIHRDGTIAPLMTHARYLEALEALWGFKTYERYPRLQCPVLMLPVLPPQPHTFEERVHLELKQQALKLARSSIRDLQVNWLKDAVHDVPLQKPDELAEQIISFAGT